MDTREIFIKMCGKSDVQELRMTKYPFAYSGNIMVIPNGEWWTSKDVWSTDWKIIWLPTQSESQLIIAKYYWGNNFPDNWSYILLDNFQKWILNVHPYWLMKYCDTMDQFWLSFMEHEVYNKQWNGTDWIKE